MPKLAPYYLCGLVVGVWAPAGCTAAGARSSAPEPAPAAAVASADAQPPAAVEPRPAGRRGLTLSAPHPGCFVLQDLDGGEPLVAGEQSCDERTIPASTFKVPHALIALDTGVVSDPEATVAWDGREYWIKAWQRDHSLRTAIHYSVVWFFQGTAKAIGRARMQEYLQAYRYGDAEVEEPIEGFWLGGGSLEVSPRETLRFWADLYRDRLPRGAQHLPRLRSMLVRPPRSFRGRMPEGTPLPEVHPQMIFSAKTGTGDHGEGSVTWLAGHVECPDREYVFVSRVIADEPPATLSPAVVHGLAALDDSGILRCERVGGPAPAQ